MEFETVVLGPASCEFCGPAPAELGVEVTVIVVVSSSKMVPDSVDTSTGVVRGVGPVAVSDILKQRVS